VNAALVYINSRADRTKASVSKAVVRTWHRAGRPKGSSVAFGDEMDRRHEYSDWGHEKQAGTIGRLLTAIQQLLLFIYRNHTKFSNAHSSIAIFQISQLASGKFTKHQPANGIPAYIATFKLFFL